ncbi:ankyrin repeat-containing protein At5g02620-like [Rhodamnia argentea]|uniref:Ankyrin repeat-containing protein At5g02620-like n=1 Tax=Rhodamnia argentea TaxID=178133 RepID=A0ABM3HZ29_9MYRT|nr:ankyrin repeat-containing protein At5g02620-like [Rhodamnia argentea]
MHPKVYEAAKSGDFDSLITTIFGNGEDLFHGTTPNGNNILHVAAQHKRVNLIEHLLRCPSGPSLLWQGNFKGDTPLHIAATLGSCEAVQVFTDLAKSLHWAIENGHVDACKELLRKPNSHKDTALHYAVRGGHDGVVKLLIEEDPQLCDITNAADVSPLYLAADRGHLDIIEMILGACSLSSSHKGPKGFTILHATIDRSLTSWRKILKKRPELIREGDEMGWTPLHYVTSMGKVKKVRLLLQHDTFVAYDVDKEGQSALHIAAFEGHLNVLDEIVKSCPDAWDIINNKGQTALHAAAIGGHRKVVEYILRIPNMECLIKEQDTHGNTALHLAALHKEYNIIYILARDKRVDRFATNKDCMTALDIFWAHNEIGYRAAKVKHVLEGSHGMPIIQDWVIEYKKRFDQQVGYKQPAFTRMSKKSIIKLQLLAAALIATVTFAAAFTMPGGYNNDGPNQGLAVLAGRATFQAFVIANSTAFGFSILALVLHCLTDFRLDSHQARYTRMAGLCICIAVLGMVLAFGCGTYAVLTRTIGLGIFPYVLCGCLFIMYFMGGFLDPHTGFMMRCSSTRLVRNFLFDWGMF